MKIDFLTVFVNSIVLQSEENAHSPECIELSPNKFIKKAHY